MSVKLQGIVALCGMLFAEVCTPQRDRMGSDGNALTAVEGIAVRAAEEFVQSRGYTDEAGQPAAVQCSPELEDYRLTPAQVLALRRNSLKRHAYGIFRGARGRADGWTVVFEFSEEWNARTSSRDRSRRVGRAVTMNLSLAELRIEHVDVRLDAVQKRVSP